MSSDYVMIKEGLARLKVPNPNRFRRPDGVYEPSWAPVFYNPRQVLNRDLSVVLLGSLEGVKDYAVLDALSGTGVRALRYVLECGVDESIANDIDPRAYRLIVENIILNKVEGRVKAFRMDANALMYMFKSYGRVFDFIDIDPFGSPAPYVRASLWAVRSGGIVGYTATDTAPLYGVKWLAGSRKYDVRLVRSDVPQEVGVRVLLGYLARRAAELEREVNPLLSFVSGHYVRVFVKVVRGALRASKIIEECVGYILYCQNCFYREVVKDLVSEELRCPKCGSGLVPLGPLWICRLCDGELLARVRGELLSGKYDYLESREALERLVDSLIIENDLPNLYNVVSPAKVCRVNIPSTKSVINCLRSMGYEAVKSYISGQYVRTNASWDDFIKCVTS